MDKFFINFGRKLGTTVNKGKWYYKSFFGSEKEAIEAEYIMGKALAADISREIQISNDAFLQNLIDDIGEKLIQKVINKQRKFKFTVVLTNDINAFALPGGYIFITNALIEKVQSNKDEIAFVLAHEIMHVVLKHPINLILTDYSTQVISNIVVKGGTFGILAKQILTSLLKSSYSQDNEFEADNYAVRLMNSAGFDPGAAKTFFKRLKPGSYGNIPIYHYFLSHPSANERTEKIATIIQKKIKRNNLSPPRP